MSFIDSILEVFYTGLFYGFVCAFFACFMSPLQFLKVIRQSDEIKYRDIVRKYYSQGGIAIFFRGMLPYATMNFWSSMAFGIAEYFSLKLGFFDMNLIASLLLRSFMGGVIETSMSIWSESKEITRNKGINSRIMRDSVAIFIPVLLRNAIFWNSSILVFELVRRFELNIIDGILFSLFIAPVFAVLALPFDVIASKICGFSGSWVSGLSFIKHNFSISKASLLGLSVRIVQIILFTMITFLTMILYDKIML
ncbi:hypothetical protein GUI12_03945 [Anaplasmataceae bacterium AB001_6]|nr:hypothetical protein GUI12_03945 [Anaplasmataceae bacterium AB001_6]